MVEDRRWRRVGRGTKGVAVTIRQRKMNKPISNTKTKTKVLVKAKRRTFEKNLPYFGHTKSRTRTQP